jgi:hypothetical protein
MPAHTPRHLRFFRGYDADSESRMMNHTHRTILTKAPAFDRFRPKHIAGRLPASRYGLPEA